MVSEKIYFQVLVSVGLLEFLLREKEQKFEFGGTIGYGDPNLEFSFRHFKVFRLQAVLHDAAGAVQKSMLLLLDWARIDFVFAWSGEWTPVPHVRKTPFVFHCQFCWPLMKQYVSYSSTFWIDT